MTLVIIASSGNKEMMYKIAAKAAMCNFIGLDGSSSTTTQPPR